MGLIKKLFLGLVFIVAVFLAVGYFLLPGHSHLERAVTIAAPKATVFAVVNDLHSGAHWSPWREKDPNAKYSFEGPARGTDSKMSWDGDPKTVGAGTQTITGSVPMQKVATTLDFGDRGVANADWLLSDDAGGTKVTWTFDSDLGSNPIAHYFGLMMDSFLGPDYEKGLANLKTYVETLPKADFAGLAVEEFDAKPVVVAYMEASSSKDDQAIAQMIGAAYHEIGKFLAKNKLTMAGAPMTINTKWDDTGYGFEAAIPIDRGPKEELPADAPVKVKETYSGKALKTVHKGSYHDLSTTYDKLYAYAAAYGYEVAGNAWDEYVSDPGTTPEADVLTNICLPVK